VEGRIDHPISCPFHFVSGHCKAYAKQAVRKLNKELERKLVPELGVSGSRVDSVISNAYLSERYEAYALLVIPGS
jgi:hypothetical protein